MLNVGDQKRPSQREWLGGGHRFSLFQIGYYDHESIRTGMLSTCNFGSCVR